MIDWLTFDLPYTGPPFGWMKYSQNMTTGEIKAQFVHGDLVESSFSSKVAVRVHESRLFVSGNPIKFLTGQNVVGSDNCLMLVELMVNKILELKGMPDCLVMRRNLPHANLKRVDCTYHYHVGSDEEVVTWLKAMELSAHVKFRGRGHFDEGMCSLLFGVKVMASGKKKGSQLSSFKFYNKFRELDKHPMTCPEQFREPLKMYARGKVRGEALIRTKDLLSQGKKLGGGSLFGYSRLTSWNGDTVLKLHNNWVGKMEISSNYTARDELVDNLPRELAVTYRLWCFGEVMQNVMNRATFYRHRKRLLEYDVDISVPRDVERKQPDVKPVLRVLEAGMVNPSDEEKWFAEILRACG